MGMLGGDAEGVIPRRAEDDVGVRNLGWSVWERR